jgi:hypothetical protein
MALPCTTPFGSPEQRRHPASPSDALCTRRLRRINWFVHSKEEAIGNLISSPCLLFSPSRLQNCIYFCNLLVNQHTMWFIQISNQFCTVLHFTSSGKILHFSSALEQFEFRSLATASHLKPAIFISHSSCYSTSAVWLIVTW